jgi:glutamate 5-kinase
MLQGAGGQGSSLGTGGMATKLSAAKIAMDAGVDMIIVNGASPEIIYDAVDGRSVGTRFIAKK